MHFYRSSVDGAWSILQHCSICREQVKNENVSFLVSDQVSVSVSDVKVSARTLQDSTFRAARILCPSPAEDSQSAPGPKRRETGSSPSPVRSYPLETIDTMSQQSSYILGTSTGRLHCKELKREIFKFHTPVQLRFC